MLCLERHCSGQRSGRPDVGKVHVLEKVLEYGFTKFVCLNNRDDLTTKLRELSDDVRSVSSTPNRVSPAQKLSRIGENVVEVEIRHYYNFETGLGMCESLLQLGDRVYGFGSRHAFRLQNY